ncbi:uncharacterized protein EDB91DRAFT_1253543 [Suillus paluster]|uniref:uncharacterized protein n=1 Tax=Suillus paluster TaxID=48578 RepID=UPI001B86D7AF|nr:uncharacterized protein EDB91DRAFT_1253543 [Suillus paluster]KAG1728275.1 hypothetical protein EDB91DRAFT_1253543 [Suillus paluster]
MQNYLLLKHGGGYILGLVTCPDPSLDPSSASHWDLVKVVLKEVTQRASASARVLHPLPEYVPLISKGQRGSLEVRRQGSSAELWKIMREWKPLLLKSVPPSDITEPTRTYPGFTWNEEHHALVKPNKKGTLHTIYEWRGFLKTKAPVNHHWDFSTESWVHNNFPASSLNTPVLPDAPLPPVKPTPPEQEDIDIDSESELSEDEDDDMPKVIGNTPPAFTSNTRTAC